MPQNEHKQSNPRLFTIGVSVSQPGLLSRLPVNQVIDFTRSGKVGKTAVRELTLRIRSNQDAETQRALKARLPWFSGSLFREKRCLNSLYQTNFIILDVDGVEDIPTIKERAIRELDPALYFAFRSPSFGVKLVYALALPIMDNDSYARAYSYLAEDLWAKLKYEADDGAKSRAQACYFSYDPDLLINPRLVPLRLDLIPAPPPTEQKSRVIDFPGEWKGKAPLAREFHRQSSCQEDYDTALSIVKYLAGRGKLDYLLWLKTGFALKARFGEAGRAIFLHYSANAAYKDSPASLSARWDRLDDPKVQFSSLIWVAQHYGWRHETN